MSLNSTTGLYEYTIPGQQAFTLVNYDITAYDSALKSQTDINAGQYNVYLAIQSFHSP